MQSSLQLRYMSNQPALQSYLPVGIEGRGGSTGGGAVPDKKGGT